MSKIVPCYQGRMPAQPASTIVCEANAWHATCGWRAGNKQPCSGNDRQTFLFIRCVQVSCTETNTRQNDRREVTQHFGMHIEPEHVLDNLKRQHSSRNSAVLVDSEGNDPTTNLQLIIGIKKIYFWKVSYFNFVWSQKHAVT